MDNIIFFRDRFIKKEFDENASKNVDKAIFKTYYSIRNAAWNFLIDNETNILPLNLWEIANQRKWNILEFTNDKNTINELVNGFNYSNYSGFTIIKNNRVFIAYNHIDTPIDRFTIAHEFGHVALAHFVHNMEYHEFEKEANMFAARILMPMCVLKECKVYLPEQIAEICGTSIQAATFRAERLELLLKRNKFYHNPLELRVLDTFTNFLMTKTLHKGEN